MCNNLINIEEIISGSRTQFEENLLDISKEYENTEYFKHFINEIESYKIKGSQTLEIGLTFDRTMEFPQIKTPIN